MSFDNLRQYIASESCVFKSGTDHNLWLGLVLPTIAGVSCEVDLGSEPENLAIDAWGQALVITYCLQLGLTEDQAGAMCSQLNDALPTLPVQNRAA